MANDVTVQFGYEDGQPSGSVQLDAPDYVARFGRRSATLEARWVTSARVAYGVASRLLHARARPRWVLIRCPSRACSMCSTALPSITRWRR